MSEQLDIEAIRARVEAATPGEWEWNDVEDIPSPGELPSKWLEIGTRYEGTGIAELSWNQKADAEFICQAHNTDIPALLARVAELEAGLRPFADTYDTYQRVIKEPGYGPLFSLDGATYEFQRAWELLNGTQQGSESSEKESAK